ncbi:sulfite exporter TauE/SafE family protein [Siculibacillus lacustris]|uniref:Probable membrane transporter protein n=1 Tax=Siculibacillus lacustris TaxID=1549641 RepID=A0A4Q9VIL1_9HYPH|nr:sulfite exporter TauE/SafE family protein [Siculibacillus lacustris]TBW35093.1 sulfite exporter TauE/SafE family protein [Siculibacillus lacustris]
MTTADLVFYLAALPAAMLVGLSKGGLPMVGMLGVPVLALAVSPLQAAGLLLPIFVVSDWFGLWAYRREYSARNLAILIPASIAGVGVGWATAAWIPEAAVTLLVGLIGVAFTADRIRVRGRVSAPRPADVPRGLFWGLLTGFTSFVSHSGAPPYQAYTLPQHMPKMIFAGTSTILFAVVNAVKLIPYWQLGQLSLDNFEKIAVLIPPAVAATFVGVRLTRWIPEALFFRLVMTALAIISVKLVWDGLHGLGVI